MSLHFIGFKGDEFTRAVRVFGEPDFIHRVWDRRAIAEVVPGDVAVFANNQHPDRVMPFTFDDSQHF